MQRQQQHRWQRAASRIAPQRNRMFATVAPWDGDRASVQRLERLSLADYDVLDPSDGSFDAEFAALQEQVLFARLPTAAHLR